MELLKRLMMEYNVLAPADEELRYIGDENGDEGNLDDTGLDLSSPPPQGQEAPAIELDDGTAKYEAYLKRKGILDADGKPIPPPEDELCNCEGECVCGAADAALEAPVAATEPVEAPPAELPAGEEVEPLGGEPEPEEDEIDFDLK